MNRGWRSLGAAHALALLAAAASAALYAQWLDAQMLALWATALALARGGLLLLDSGLKTALVRRATLPDAASLRRLGRVSALVAVALAAAIALLAGGLHHSGRLGAGAAWLLALYPAAYLLSYPPLLPALARLEHAQRFGPVGRAEATSVLIEFGLPALCIAGGGAAWAAFATAALLARALRCLWIVLAARDLDTITADSDAVAPAALLREGLGVQAVAALSMLRDQTHLWLLAPWFGTHWAGMYTLALTACALLTQASVQTASRMALPQLRSLDPAQRWPQVLAQTRRLAIGVLPPLALLPAWLAHADAAWWDGRWAGAVAIAPWLVARMLPGVAVSAVGAWLLVARAPWRSAAVHAAWTAVEVLCAGIALLWLGPIGLAVAAALTPWCGLLLFLAAVAPQAPLWPRAAALARVLLLRPSLWAALLLAAWAHAQPALLPLATLALLPAWLCEAPLRHWLRSRRDAAITRTLPHEAA